MKRILQPLLITIGVLLFGNIQLSAQCTNAPNGDWPDSPVVLNQNTTAVTLTACAYTGEYSVVTAVQSGKMYTVGSSTSTNYITVTSDDGITIIAHGLQPFTFTTLSTANLRIYRHDNVACGVSSSGCRTITMTCIDCTPPPPPANDNCMGATPFPTIPTNGDCVTLSNQSTANATASGVTPTGACSSTSGTADDDVWFSFVAPASTVIMTGTNVSGATDVFWHVFSGTCGSSMTSILCTDTNSGGTLTGLTIGNTYYIRLYTWSSGVSTVQNICLRTPPPPPSNDECTNAIPLTPGSSCNFTQYTVSGATGSAGPPAPGCAAYSGGDVWFSAVVPSTGRLIIDTNTGVVTDGGMAIYSGNCAALTLIECDDDDSANGLMPMIDRSGLTPGSTIYIRFWEYLNDNPGTFSICAWAPAPPCNAPGTPAASNVGPNAATLSWAAASGALTYDWTVGTGGSCPTGTGANTASTSVNISGLTPNTTYRFCVRTSTCGGGSASTYQTITFTTLPLPNDNCIGAIPVSCNSIVTGSTVGATSDAAVGSCGAGTGGTPGTGVWHSLAGDGSQITLNLCASAYDTKVHVYTGSCGAFTCVASNDDNGAICTGATSRSQVVFNTNPGTTYYILVSGFGSATGAYSMNVGCVCGAPLSFPWMNTAIGSVTGEGIDNVCGGSIDVASTGYSPSLTSDALYFSNQTLCGNQSITVKVVNVTNDGFAGIMFRDSTNTGSKMVAIKTQLNPFVHREVRTTLNGAKAMQQIQAPGHTWLRLTRSGNTFTGFTSTNGIVWKQAFIVTNVMNNCLRVGLFTQGVSPASPAQAVFSMVSGFPPPVIPLNLPELGLNEGTHGLTVFPNPASDDLNLKMGEEFMGKSVSIQVMDQMGRLVFNKQIDAVQSQMEQINVANLPGGMYIISLQSEGQVAQIQKFIVSGSRP